MALSKIDAVNFLTGTIPSGNVANATLNAVTALPGAIATGKVLQVVSSSSTTSVCTTSTSYGDIGISLNITPSATSSKIYLVYSGCNETNGTGKQLQIQMLRDSTQIAEHKGGSLAGSGLIDTHPISKLDAPSSSSQITYKMQGKSVDGTIMCFNLAGFLGTLTAMEIAG